MPYNALNNTFDSIATIYQNKIDLNSLFSTTDETTGNGITSTNNFYRFRAFFETSAQRTI